MQSQSGLTSGPPRRVLAAPEAPGRPSRGSPPWSRWARTAVAAVALLVLVLVPASATNDSVLLTLSTIFMWIALTSSWNIISGFTGYIDFGHVVFFGVGAYTTGILMNRWSWQIWWTLPVAAVLALLLAVLLGRPLLRLRGVYFSIAMLGAFMAIRELTRIATPLTGGSPGLTLPPVLNRPLFYFLFLACAVVVVALARWVRASQLGSSLLAIRDDEEGAEARGVNVTALKLSAFCTAACLTSVIGSLWAYQTTFIDPDIVFREVFLINLALMTVLGGLGTVWGPVVGAVTFIAVRDTLWARVPELHSVLFGVALIAIVLLLPEGIIGTARRPHRSAAGRGVLRLVAAVRRRGAA